MTTTTRAFDQARFDAFLHKMVNDVGAAVSGALVVLGDRLGFYKALACRPQGMTSAELAEATGTHERYVREWLANQAAGGYLDYDGAGERYVLPAEHAPMLADEQSPVLMCGIYEIAQTIYADEPRLADAFRSGAGLGWHEHDERLFAATERFFRPGYNAHIVADWIPALASVEAKLRVGASVVDVGCGLGTSTILMAQAYPHARFVGVDYHLPSIERARKAARDAGVEDRVRFDVGTAQTYAGDGFDFACCFDCIHDMGDPVGALAHIRSTLAAEGTLMIVEPFANDRLEDNLNPIGRVMYGCSTTICTPASLAQEGRMGLGAQAGEARFRAIAQEAGFSRFRRAAETPFNLIYELRP